MSSDLIPAPMPRGGCGIVVLLLACGLIARHTSRLVSTLCRYLDRLCGKNTGRYFQSHSDSAHG